MDYSTTDIIEFPIEAVFGAHRDHLADLDMPNVESIEIISREADGPITKIVNVWTAAQTEIPSLLRPFVKPEMMKWTDYATWDENARACNYKIELGFLKAAINCYGTNSMETTPEGHTAVTISGKIEVDAKAIPGVPKFMAKKVGSAVESFIVKTITPNLKKTNDGVREYLKSLEA